MNWCVRIIKAHEGGYYPEEYTANGKWVNFIDSNRKIHFNSLDEAKEFLAKKGYNKIIKEELIK
jgi:hypothetical protein